MQDAAAEKMKWKAERIVMCVCDVILANGHGEAKTAHLTEGLKINKTFNNI